ncbi:MAG: serine protease [bacterium]|nr:serine protease [bacterium]
MERALKQACLVLLSVGLIGVPAGSQQPSLAVPDQRAIPMLVGITASQQRWSGTGVIVGNGIVLTARHVVAGKMQLYLPNAVVEGHLACQEKDADIAVVTSDLISGAPSYRLSASSPSIGDVVRIGGYPQRRWKVAAARVIGVAPSGKVGGVPYNSPILLLRPDSALGPGASGSPLLNGQGQVVGILAGGAGGEDAAFPISTGLRACRGFL